MHATQCLVLLSVTHFSTSVVYDPALGLTRGEDPRNISVIAKFVKDTIKEYPVVIFSKTYCDKCNSVKQVFDKLHQWYEAFEINRREEAAAILDVLQEITGSNRIPRVFVNGECVGSETDVIALNNTGKLQQMLQQMKTKRVQE